VLAHVSLEVMSLLSVKILTCGHFWSGDNCLNTHHAPLTKYHVILEYGINADALYDIFNLFIDCICWSCFLYFILYTLV